MQHLRMLLGFLRVYFMQAYRVACHLGDQEETLDATMRITSSTVFNKILLFMIKQVNSLALSSERDLCFRMLKSESDKHI